MKGDFMNGITLTKLRPLLKRVGFVITMIGLIVVAIHLFIPKTETINYSTFVEKLENNQVRLVELTSDCDEIRGIYQNDKSFYTDAPNNTSPKFLEMLKKQNVVVMLDYRVLK